MRGGEGLKCGEVGWGGGEERERAQYIINLTQITPPPMQEYIIYL